VADERKGFLLRIPESMLEELRRWAEQEMRSVNGQVEFLLREAMQKRLGRDPEDRVKKRGK
jgi:hypothetical protein